KPSETKPTTVAETTTASDKEQEKPTEAAAEAEQPTQLTALAPQQPKSSSLFGIFAKSKSTEPEPTQAEEQSAETAPADTAKEEKATATAEPEQTAVAKPAEAEKPVQVTSLFGSTKSAYASPQRPTASQGSIARLFSGESPGTRSDRTESKKLAVAKPVSPSAKHDYNYSLPGVRPN